MDKGSETIVREWLAEFKSLPETSILSYADAIPSKEDALDALIKLFKSNNDERNLLQPVCHQLFEFYRSGFQNLKIFAMNLFPSIILHHIITSNDDSTSTDTLLLSIYAISSEHSSEETRIEIPQLGYPSIYHDPMSGIFSEQMLNIQTPGRKFYQKPSLPNHHVIIPSNRFQILTLILNIYFEHISLMKRKSHLSLCEACKFLSASGFTWGSKYLGDSSKSDRRFPLSVPFMVRMLRCLHFTMYNKCLSESLQAIKAMNRRARKELNVQVVFLCNAILNSVKEQSVDPEVGETPPYGLASVNLTPLLTRETSRKGGRWAATARSIKDHRWKHHNEEISGDLSRSLQSPELSNHPPRLGQIPEPDDTNKTEKFSTTSPAKLLKSKLKKSATSGSPGFSSISEKTKSPAPSSGEKKSKKFSFDKSGDDQENEKSKQSPPLRKETPTKSQLTTSASQKHQSLEESSSTKKQRGVSVSKSSSEVGRTSIGGKHRDESDVTSSLLDGNNHDITNGSAESDERTKESYPLLSDNESPLRSKNTTQQTAF